MSSIINTQDTPMACCGMMLGHGFHRMVPTGDFYVVKDWGGHDRRIEKTRLPTQQDQEDRLAELISKSSDYQRNCVMITLSSEQTIALEAAKKLGFQTIQEFWNPNSGCMVYIMTYVHFDSKEDYDGEWD